MIPQKDVNPVPTVSLDNASHATWPQYLLLNSLAQIVSRDTSSTPPVKFVNHAQTQFKDVPIVV